MLGLRAPMKPLQFLFDNRDPHSLAYRLRRRRFALTERILDSLPKPARVLDVGGTENYWKMMGKLGDPSLDLTILNMNPKHAAVDNVRFIAGDARDLSSIGDGEYDLAFSNSVIEHVGGWADQLRMASEVRRVGKAYCVQTPNHRFPVEPHFVFPCFQYLPIPARVWLVRRFRLGWFPRQPDRAAAHHLVTSIRLLTRSEFSRLFPDGIIVDEKLLGLTKSFTAYRLLS